MTSTAPPIEPAREWSLRDAASLGGSLALWAVVAILVLTTVQLDAQRHLFGVDTHAYWRAAREAHPYGPAPGARDAYEYSPVFLDLMRPLGALPFGVVFVAWSVVELTIFVWLTRGVRWRWRGPILAACLPQLFLGNLHGFYSLVLVVMARWPEAWALGFLTKLTPGALGVVWHAARREWRHVARAVGFTAALAAVSFVVQPHLWQEWMTFLRTHGSGAGIAVLVRFGLSGVITLLAARTRQTWLLPWALVLAEPVWGSINKSLAMIPVSVYLARRDRGQRRQVDA